MGDRLTYIIYPSFFSIVSNHEAEGEFISIAFSLLLGLGLNYRAELRARRQATSSRVGLLGIW